MSYIGSTPTTQSFIAGTDSFSGTGAQTAFTLTRSVNSVNDVQVVVNNVVQYPPHYSVSGNTLTISPAPSAGTDNVYVRYLSTTLQSVGVGDLTVSTAKIQTSAVTTAKIADANITAAKLDGAQNGSAPIYAARAWVDFNGTGTVAIKASGNVSSITDNAVGVYTVNFATAMSDVNFCAVGSSLGSTGASYATFLCSNGVAKTASSVRVENRNFSTGAVIDDNDMNVTVFR